MSRSRARIASCWLGRVPYQRAWDLQRSLVEQVRAGAAPSTLLLLEHPHVYTMGRKANEDNVLWDEAERRRRSVDLVWSDRGGDVTYHGPGQLVGYPVVDLAGNGLDLLVYLRTLEQSLIDYLAGLGIRGSAVPGLTGVWTDAGKVAAIGVKSNGGVVSHGFALNLTTEMDYFGGIVPCGLVDKEVTSVELLTGRSVPTEEGAHAYAHHFSHAFRADLEWTDPEIVANWGRTRDLVEF